MPLEHWHLVLPPLDDDGYVVLPPILLYLHPQILLLVLHKLHQKLRLNVGFLWVFSHHHLNLTIHRVLVLLSHYLKDDSLQHLFLKEKVLKEKVLKQGSEILYILATKCLILVSLILPFHFHFPF